MSMKNRFTIEGNTLIVYNRKDGSEILFDSKDFDIIKQSSWFIHGGRYATATTGVFRKISAHRLLMGNPKNKQVDHINGNKLDNRRINLRVVTAKENSQNNRKARGYYWSKKSNKWHVQIAVNGKNKHIGLFNDESEARNAYLIAKTQYHPSAPIELWKN